MSEWQPIETAPKDGTQVIIFARGSYGDFDQYWSASSWFDHNQPGAIGEIDGWGDWPYSIRPTHWRPLPSPPSITG